MFRFRIIIWIFHHKFLETPGEGKPSKSGFAKHKTIHVDISIGTTTRQLSAEKNTNRRANEQNVASQKIWTLAESNHQFL